MFTPEVTKNILDVTLLEDVKEDLVVWKKKSNGEYSVNTRYKLLKGIQQETRDGSIEGDLSSFCRIRAPPKVKNLLCRICHECIPTRVRLRQHHVPCPSVCQLCEGQVEYDYHIFFSCEWNVPCWS